MRTVRSVPQVATSDHKPVVGAFRAAPSPKIERTTNVQASIRIRGLCLRDILAADFTGTSDPFCCFYTHPQGLIATQALGRAPRTTVKWGIRPGEEIGP